MRKHNLKLRSSVTIAMLSSIAFLLMLLDFPLPWFPVFLKIDFSDVPALIAAITMGPVAGIVVELIKNILDWLFKGAPTGVPVGHMANFVTGILFILPTYYVYKRFNTIRSLIVGIVLGTLTMSIGMSVLNYAIFLPMYTYFLGWGSFDMYEMIVLGILPFNIIKGCIVLVISVMLFRTMKVWIDKQRNIYLS